MPRLIDCLTCGQHKEHGARGLCKSCYGVAWGRRNPDKRRAATRAWATRNPWRRRQDFLKSYGVSEQDIERRFLAQGGKCAICRREAYGSARNTRSLHIDHDHETGLLRGLLCHSCNLALGLFLDSPELLRTAAEYVEEWKDAAETG